MPLIANIDEAAARIHESRLGRVLTALGAGGLGSLLVPARLCAIWVVWALMLEVAGYFCTRRQFAGRAVTRRTQLAFSVYYATICLTWITLSLTFWRLGGPQGQTFAAVIFSAVGALIFLLMFQSPAAFIFAGAVPPLTALIMVVIGARLATLSLLPTAGALVLTMGFFHMLARAAPSALATQRRLNASQAEYRVIVDTISDVIARSDVEGRRIYLSPSVKRLIGYDAEALSDHLLDSVHPEDRPLVDATADLVIADGAERTIEHRLQHRDGRTVWVETNIALAAFAGPTQPREIITVTRDISARKALELDLIEAKHEAEAASAAKSDFLANMSHELRTPLNAVIGFSGVLRRAEGLAAEHARYASLINDGSTTLLAVINNLLDFSRLEVGGVTPDCAPFCPSDLVQSMTTLLSLEASKKDIALTVEDAWIGDPVSGDVTLIRQVLLNLIGNALKFTERGEVRVSLSGAPAGPDQVRLRIAVSDTGIGMTEAQLGRIFERFVQADGSVSRRFGGSGLGLAICQSIVTLLGGRIGATSEPGVGSTFWFELDLARADPGALAVAPTETPGDGQAPPRRLKLLVVDDTATNRELVGALLSPFDIEVATAADGSEAVAMAARDPYDLILMDLQMPIMDGFAATRAIRQLGGPGAAEIPIIALTANVLPDQVARCYEAGMNGHVGKPIDPSELLRAIASLTEPSAEAEPALAG